VSDNGRCKTCGGEGEIETGQTTAARCVDCGGTGRTGGEPPNPPLTVPDAPIRADVKTHKWEDIKARARASGKAWASEYQGEPGFGMPRPGTVVSSEGAIIGTFRERLGEAVTQSGIKPTPSRDYSERLPRHPNPQVIEPRPLSQLRAMQDELDAINRDLDENKARALEHAKEGARRYRTDPHFKAMVHLVASAINGLIDGWDEVGDREHLARRVRETVMDILPAVEAIQSSQVLVAGDEMFFTIELLEQIARTGRNTAKVRVKSITRVEDRVKVVELEKCTD
jgi:hypothetical protein